MSVTGREDAGFVAQTSLPGIRRRRVRIVNEASLPGFDGAAWGCGS